MNSLFIARLIIKRTIGTRKSIIMLVLLPIIVISGIIGLFGKASDDKALIAVLNEDQSWMGDRIIQSVQSIDSYQIEMQDPSTAKLEQLKNNVYDGKWAGLIHIPAGFTEKMLAGDPIEVNLFRKNEQLWSASLGITLKEATGKIAQSVQLVSLSGEETQRKDQLVPELLQQQEEWGIPVIHTKIVNTYNNAFVLVVGLTLLFIMILANQSIHGIMEDRGNRTMARMFTAPVRAFEIALGNFLGCLILGTLQLVLILAVTRYVIGFDFGLSFGKLLIIMEFFLLAAVGISSAVAGIVKNSANLGSINNLVVIPTCMIGGCFWPVSMMPEFMQKLSSFTPQRWAIVAMERASFGSTLSDIGLELGILLLFAAVLLAFGSYVLRPAQS
ncbi:ABC transporter permease [Cohnella abietis]|uniref:Multidrug ABC transporter ATP-binding protein n=1 Tax=Cohnella abietis TaxID=2507935 RepID=A0A3T1D936_9BACL|nr:ABC transporter permease [Cohnella abietis]BBI34584.1 multidrug ABC transporter ATP-binding protein [Cohnella abietis]